MWCVTIIRRNSSFSSRMRYRFWMTENQKAARIVFCKKSKLLKPKPIDKVQNRLTWTLPINIVPHNKYKFASEKIPFTSSTSLSVKPNCLRARNACSTCKISRSLPTLIGVYVKESGNFVVFEFISIKSFKRVFRKSFWMIGRMSFSLVILKLGNNWFFQNENKLMWLQINSGLPQ